MGSFSEFSEAEKRNMIRYIIGSMLYKFALETLNGCMASIVLKRTNPEFGPNKVWTIMLSLNYACQCIGSILVTPLVRRFKVTTVLARSTLLFGLVVLVVPVLEGVTGGGRKSGLGDERKYSPGNWNPLILFAIYPVTGIFYGMVELIQLIIPSDIVGADEIKLKKMNSLVHIFYETAGTSGALLSSYWIAYFNYGYSLSIIPVMFSLACVVWMTISVDKQQLPKIEPVEQPGQLVAEIKNVARTFFHSVYIGAKAVVSQRSLIWLVFAYSLPLVLHRYLENVLFAQYAATGLGVGSYQQKLVAGSNLGEMIGAFFVFIYSKEVATPLPWLRLDAISLVIVWIFPLVDPLSLNMSMFTWMICLLPVMASISFGWAAGDCSLVAYVQSRFANVSNQNDKAPSLGSVMAFLYVLYIILFAFISPGMGAVHDSFLKPLTDKFGQESPIQLRLPLVRQAMIYTAGVFVTCCGAIILAATFIPRGSFAFNPKSIDSGDSVSDTNQSEKIKKSDF